MANDITILSCPQCGFPRIRDCGNGLYQCDDCGTHFDKDENIVLTEQEWLQTAKTEQLAEWIYQLSVMDRIDQPWYFTPIRGSQKIVEWLKQPHTKE